MLPTSAVCAWAGVAMATQVFKYVLLFTHQWHPVLPDSCDMCMTFECLSFLLSLDSAIHYQGFSNSWSPILLEFSLFESLFLLCWGRNARNESVIWCMQHSTFAVAFLAGTAWAQHVTRTTPCYVHDFTVGSSVDNVCVYIIKLLLRLMYVCTYDPGWSGHSVCKEYAMRS